MSIEEVLYTARVKATARRSCGVLGWDDSLFSPLREAREDKSGKQNGDPDKAAPVILDLVTLDEPLRTCFWEATHLRSSSRRSGRHWMKSTFGRKSPAPRTSSTPDQLKPHV
jgi:hypothetical protein